jgi:transcriptional regulator with XRE-family HTH domain
MDDLEFPDLEARFRSRFIAARKRRGLNQEDVAARLEITQQTVARFELGQRGLAANDMPAWAHAVEEHWRELIEDENVWNGTLAQLRKHLGAQRLQLTGIREGAEQLDRKAEGLREELVALEPQRARQWAAVRWAESNVADTERLLAEREKD